MRSILSLILMSMAVAVLVQGLIFLMNENRKEFSNQIIVWMSFFAFSWCFGYACMGICKTIFWASVFRAVSLLGIYGYIILEAWFAGIRFHVFEWNKKGPWLAYFILPAIPCWLLLVFSPSLKFITSSFGMTFVDGFLPRFPHFLYICLIIGFCVFSSVHWLIVKKPSRFERKKVYALMISGLCIVAGGIFDVFLPLLGQASFPGSCFGVFIAFTVLCILSRRYNAFHFSQLSMMQHIYSCVHLPILVFNKEQRLELANESGKSCLKGTVSSNAQIYLSDFFKLTQEDASSILKDVFLSGQSKHYRLILQKTGSVCQTDFTVISDKYGDICNVMCLVQNLGTEGTELASLEQKQLMLQHQLSEKNRLLEQSTLQILTTIANMIDSRDEILRGHSQRVARCVELFVKALNYSDEDVLQLKYIALLHDIGKIGVADSLSSDKQNLAQPLQNQAHTVLGGELLKGMTLVPELSSGALYHHEHFDGTGYPSGLSGENIPVAARIIALADAYDHLLHSQKSSGQIYMELKQGRGTLFDPQLTDTFLKLIQTPKFCENFLAEDLHEPFTNEGSILLRRVMNNLEQQSRHDAESDYLTGLPNRRGGEKRIRAAMLKSGGCLMILDLDNLKRVNDLYGHLAGDEALKLVAEVLEENRHNAISARLSGDEFLFYMFGVKAQENAQAIVEGIRYTFRNRIETNISMKGTSLSMGLCLCEAGEDFSEVFMKADKALYRVKQNGKGQYLFYTEEDDKSSAKIPKDLSFLMETLCLQGDYQGVFNLEYREFCKTCNYLLNLSQRTQNSLLLMMVTLNPQADPSLDDQEQGMDILSLCIRQSLRKTDVYTRYSNTQFLILLVSARDSNEPHMSDRISSQFFSHVSSKEFALNFSLTETIYASPYSTEPVKHTAHK